jgi:5'-nucleotidase
MKLLLTNDDGINAEGLISLEKVLSREHEVYVMAPSGEQSACSNAITVRRPLTVQAREDDRHYQVDGYPADCVNIGIQGDVIPEIDIVVSGINHGLNIGDDIFFSGTVAGARTAYIFGVSGVAVSLDSYHAPSRHFDDAAEFVLSFIKEYCRDRDNPFLYNINFPDVPASEYLFVEFTRIGRRKYVDSYLRSDRENGDITMTLDGTPISIHSQGTDVTVIEKGGVSITPMMVDCTDYSSLDTLTGKSRSWMKKNG